MSGHRGTMNAPSRILEPETGESLARLPPEPKRAEALQSLRCKLLGKLKLLGELAEHRAQLLRNDALRCHLLRQLIERPNELRPDSRLPRGGSQ